MFYSHTVEDSKFNLFTSMLNTVVNGKGEHKSFVDNVIEESHALVTGEKTIYQLNKETFPITVYLAEHAPELMRNIDIHDLAPENYKEIYSVLREENTLAVFA